MTPVDRTAEFCACLTLSSTSPQDGKGADDGSVDNSGLAVMGAMNATVPFTTQSVELSNRIRDMRSELVRQRRQYSDFSPIGMTDASRDALDSSVASFVRVCMTQIDGMKTEAVMDLKRRRGQASFAAHRLGCVAILNEQLQSVTKISEEMRSVRIRQAVDAKVRSQVRYSKKAAKEAADFAKQQERAAGGGGPEDSVELQEYAQEFAAENEALVSELIERREQVRDAERAVAEIASLNHVFATKVLEQAREIETLYDLAVEATSYVDLGNRELRKMKTKGPVLKYAIAGVVAFLTLAMLFFDWLHQRRTMFLPL